MNIVLERRQIEQVAEQIAPMCDGDEDLLHDMMTGQTDIDWVVARLHEQLARDGEMLAGITARQVAIAERKARIESRCSKVKEQIGAILRAARLTRLELPEVTYSVREDKPALKVVDPEAVPDELTRVKREPDKRAINEQYGDRKDVELPNWLVREPAKDVVTGRVK